MTQKQMLAALAVVVVVVIAIVAFAQSKDGSNENGNDNMNTSANLNSNTDDAMTNTNTEPTQATTPGTNEAMTPDGNDVQVYEVSYDGKAFTPSALTIKNGDVVVFKNNSDRDFWPASAPHPTHTLYPEFDPKKAIAAGGTWQFKFTKVGTWAYHDHENATAFGKITVQ